MGWIEIADFFERRLRIVPAMLVDREARGRKAAGQAPLARACLESSKAFRRNDGRRTSFAVV
jgi:hypothetical protein